MGRIQGFGLFGSRLGAAGRWGAGVLNCPEEEKPLKPMGVELRPSSCGLYIGAEVTD